MARIYSAAIFICCLAFSLAQNYPIREQRCSTSTDCTIEGECCQSDGYSSVHICLPYYGQTNKCIGRIIPSITVPVDPTASLDKGGFCPPREARSRCRSDRQCPGTEKCCDGQCSPPIYH